MCYLEDLVHEIKDNKELVVDIDSGLIKLYRKGIRSFASSMLFIRGRLGL